MKFDVRFTFSRFPLRNMHRALEIMGKGQTNWKNWLFPDPSNFSAFSSSQSSQPALHLNVSRLMEENQEQKLAVRCALSSIKVVKCRFSLFMSKLCS